MTIAKQGMFPVCIALGYVYLNILIKNSIRKLEIL